MQRVRDKSDCRLCPGNTGSGGAVGQRLPSAENPPKTQMDEEEREHRLPALAAESGGTGPPTQRQAAGCLDPLLQHNFPISSLGLGPTRVVGWRAVWEVLCSREAGVGGGPG